MIEATSLEAFMVLKPDLGRLQNMVFNTLRLYPGSSNHDISRYMSKPINVITPRVKELREMGIVVFSHYKVDKDSNMRVMCWKPVTPC